LERRWGGVNWIDLCPDRDQWKFLVKEVNDVKYYCTTGGFSRKYQLHEVITVIVIIIIIIIIIITTTIIITIIVIFLYHITVNRDSAVGIATDYRLDDRGFGFRVPVGSRIFSSPRRPDRLWGLPNLLSNGYQGSMPMSIVSQTVFRGTLVVRVRPLYGP
jgi:hypothetical protein